MSNYCNDTARNTRYRTPKVPAEGARWHATMVVRIAAGDEVEKQHGVSRWNRVQFRTRSFCSAQRLRTFTPT